jgi:hypothetical protein
MKATIKTPNVDNLIVKISCETTGITEERARAEVGQITTERKLELVDKILGHMQLFTTDSEEPIKDKRLKPVQ